MEKQNQWIGVGDRVQLIPHSGSWNWFFDVGLSVTGVVVRIEKCKQGKYYPRPIRNTGVAYIIKFDNRWGEWDFARTEIELIEQQNTPKEA